MKRQRLTLAERYQIEALRKSRIKITAIANQLGRCKSVISRELKRNSFEEIYKGNLAQIAYLERRINVHSPLKMTGRIETLVLDKLSIQWSPEQISGRFKKSGVFISHETIYKYIYREFKLGNYIYLNLRRKRKWRWTQKTANSMKRCGKRLSYPSISLRPQIVEKRKRIGDFERDTVLGKFNGPVLLSVVDRVTRFMHLTKVRKINANLTHLATVKLLKKERIHTITNDNGPEFADYKRTAATLNAQIYFNDPYSSWQRGTNENTNGLVRQYFPKGTDFTRISKKQIQTIEDLINNRPRKCLGYKSPSEVKGRIKSELH